MYWNVPRIVPSCVSGFACVGISVSPCTAELGSGAGETEIEKLRAGLRQYHVARLAIAVDDALFVCTIERVGALRSVAKNLIGRQGPFVKRRGPNLSRWSGLCPPVCQFDTMSCEAGKAAQLGR
jgi:hypothetical protein